MLLSNSRSSQIVLHTSPKLHILSQKIILIQREHFLEKKFKSIFCQNILTLGFESTTFCQKMLKLGFELTTFAKKCSH